MDTIEVVIKPQVYDEKVFQDTENCYLNRALVALGYRDVSVFYDVVTIGTDIFDIMCEGYKFLMSPTFKNNFARGVDTVVTLVLRVPKPEPVVTVINEGVERYENVSSDLNIEFA